jgi:hypothetical protein
MLPCSRATMASAAPLPCLFGSSTVAIPIGDMFERGELTDLRINE